MDEFVKIEDAESVLSSLEVKQHTDGLKEYAELGFDIFIFHSAGRNHEEFMNVFEENMLPKL